MIDFVRHSYEVRPAITVRIVRPWLWRLGWQLIRLGTWLHTKAAILEVDDAS